MKTQEIEIKENTLIQTGAFMISIGRTTEEIAIISKTSGEFCKFKDMKKGGRLAKIKRAFKIHLCSTTDFCFGRMAKQDTLRLIEMCR